MSETLIYIIIFAVIMFFMHRGHGAHITPVIYRRNYLIYENKPCTEENSIECLSCVENRIKMSGEIIGYFEWGDSLHYNTIIDE